MMLSLLTGLCLLMFGAASGPAPAGPAPAGPGAACTALFDSPDPTLAPMAVEMKGEATDLTMTFDVNETWELTTPDGEVVGWGDYTWDEKAGTIDYENASEDGGGGQTGTYTWDPETATWERTSASHPDAPPVSLLPPL